MLPRYKRILLKLSGESLSSESADPFDPKIIAQYAHEIKTITDIGVEVALVIGGGNIYRGLNESESGIERAHGDYIPKALSAWSDAVSRVLDCADKA